MEMYQSRLHATNGIISVAVDSLNGEILEFTRESTWDNVVKKRKKFPEFGEKKNPTLYLDKNLQLPFSTLSLAKYLNRVAITELN